MLTTERNGAFRCQARDSADMRDQTVAQICAAFREKYFRQLTTLAETGEVCRSLAIGIHMQASASTLRQPENGT